MHPSVLARSALLLAILSFGFLSAAPVESEYEKDLQLQLAVNGTDFDGEDEAYTKKPSLNPIPTTKAAPPPPELRQAAGGATSSATSTAGAAEQNVNILTQVNKILQNVGMLNLAGVVEESLNAAAAPEIRDFVNGIVRGVFCNPLTSVFNNCGVAGAANAGGSSTASSSSTSGTNSDTRTPITGPTGTLGGAFLANLLNG